METCTALSFRTKGMNVESSPQNGDGSASRVPKFFKIIFSSGIHRLRLPTEFTRRYGHDLADCVSLEVPSGLVWKVESIHSDGETWLLRGWQQFEEHYSIRFGHFLVFKYVRNSHFKVHIFDTTAIEIEYFRYDSGHDRGLNRAADEAKGIESDLDNSAVFLKEFFAGKDAKSKDRDDDDDDTRYEHSEGTESKYSDRKRGADSRFEAYKRASAFMSEKPTGKPFSIVVMQPSYVNSKRPALNIPAAFAREVLPGKVNSLILHVSQGKTWLVRCVYGKDKASLTSGWLKFVEDNALKVGDACVFEVLERINLTWNVIIFRG